MSEQREEVYVPKERADVDRRKQGDQKADELVKRPQQFSAGNKIWKQNKAGLAEYEVTVISAKYDDKTHAWMYKLKDYKGEEIAGETPELQLEISK